MTTAIYIAFFTAFVGLPYLALMRYLRKRAIEHQHSLIEEAFKARVQQTPALGFAALVRRKDSVSGENAMSIQTDRIYRCEDGTYLFFLCTSGEPGYLTELSEQRVRDALRSSPEILAMEFPGK